MDYSSFFAPKLDGKSLSNILPSLLKVKGLNVDDSFGRKVLEKDIFVAFSEAIKTSKRIVLFQIDGLGYDRILKVKEHFSFLKGDVYKVYSTFPTYTLCSFCSFVTGLLPGEHGLLAGTFKLGNEIKWAGQMLDHKDLFWGNSLLFELEKNHYKTYSIKYDLHKDDYNNRLYPNSIFVDTKVGEVDLTQEARVVETRVFAEIEKFCRKKFYFLSSYFYYLDALTGRFGKFSPEAINYLRFVFEKIGEMAVKFPKDTLFLFMGDHGHTSIKENVLLDQKLMQEIYSETGSVMALDGRMISFYGGNLVKTKELFEKTYGKYIEEMSRDDYLRLIGLTERNEILKRIGDLIYTAKPEFTLRNKIKNSLATHGGISQEEFATVFGFFGN